ncbi:GNAT family N-acetyltransferase [Nocardiopsis sp. EMB25]|uniref:GNAT family N-acetyltransferase n=1 Tax=Nocardiopsis TaxID=2013 RepID=UPI0003473EE7|nr:MULTISPECIES: GNAT family N-acetyltransferase [Nocardiopsis]MCY9784900.1 GNAT family N-acetyltransferase [Nocardiopsis sp. EMB25]
MATHTPTERPGTARVRGLRLVRLDRTAAEVAVLRETVLRHRLAPGQSRYTGLPVQTLPSADADPARVPFAVVRTGADAADPETAREACAGFGIVDRVGHLRDLVDTPEHAVLLRAFYVIPAWQGLGVGRTACSAPLLDLLVAGVAPRATEIVLCVNEANEVGRRTYRSAGFAPTGRTHLDDLSGPQLVLSRPVRTGACHRPLPKPRPERTENQQ